MLDNPYKILGVSKNASKDEIRQAYRRLAAKHHPDRNDGDDVWIFQQIQEAYRRLSGNESSPEKPRPPKGPHETPPSSEQAPLVKPVARARRNARGKKLNPTLIGIVGGGISAALLSLVVLFKTHKVFGIVVAESAESWMVRHSFLCSAHYEDAASECSGKIGHVQISDQYNGCKHCGNDSLVQCDHCKEYSCYRAGGFSPIKTVKCGNCGVRGFVSGMAKSMTISGD